MMSEERRNELAGILGVGYSVPSRVFTNKDFEEYGVSADFVEFYFGVNERRLSEEKSYSDLAVEAAQNAMKDAGINPEDIDMIISNTATNDHYLPHSGTLLQQRLNLRSDVMVLNTNVICCGMNYAMSIASKFISSGVFKTVLIITGDVLFRMALGQTAFSGMFGDGVGALIMRKLKSGHEGIIAETYGARGELYDVMGLYSLGSRDNDYGHIYENEFDIKVDLKKGANIPLYTVQWFKESFEKCLAQRNLTVDDIAFVSTHPVSIPQINEQLLSMNIPEDKTLIVTDKYGHCASGTAPIVLTEARNCGKIKPGDLVYSFNVAAGYQYGGIIFKWHDKTDFE
jgi:3-oxoacyl-[acyl-carrier-protein] synthase-3